MVGRFPFLKIMVKCKQVSFTRVFNTIKKDLQILKFAGPSITYKKILSCLYFFY